MVRYHDQRFRAESKPLHLHSGGHHFKRLACAHFVGKQGVSTIHNMGNGVDLMRPQGNFRIHSAEPDMASVILTGPNGIKGFIVDKTQLLPTVDIFPNPLGKLLLDQLLPVLGNGGFLLVENRLFIAVFVLYIVEHPHIPLIQRLFQNLICIHPFGSIGGGCFDIAPVCIFIRDGPLPSGARPQDFDAASSIIAGAKGFCHKLLIDLHGNPVCTDTNPNFSSSQINRLHCFQRCNIPGNQRFLFSR